MTDEPVTRVKTTETSLDVVDALRERDGARLDELAAALDLAESTVHRHLSTLRRRGYVVKSGERYRVGLQFLTVGGAARRRIPAYTAIKAKVDRLAEETDERAQFIVMENGERVYVYTETGESAVQTGAHTGRRGPIQSSAAGKAILANLAARKRDRLIDSLDLVRTGPNTITDRDELREHLASVRERGVAFNLQESTAGVHAVGAAVSGRGGEVIGALSVSGPATRLKDDRLETELPDVILAATNELELQIEHA